jgi:hypothetical protein
LGIKSYILTSNVNFFDGLKFDNYSTNNIERINEILILKFLRRYKVFRALFRKLLFPDQYVSWLPFAIYKGKKIIRKNKITHIFIMVPPASNLLLGYLLKIYTNVRIILYFGDLWTANPYLNLKNRYYYNISKILEKAILKKADSIICASPEYINILKKYDLADKKLHFLPFGYDEDSYKNIKSIKYKKFTIVHAGTIYPGNYVNPIHFLKAVKLLIDENSKLRDDFHIIFCGKIPIYVKKLVKKFNLDKIIHVKGLLPQKDALKLIKSSNNNFRFFSWIK